MGPGQLFFAITELASSCCLYSLMRAKPRRLAGEASDGRCQRVFDEHLLLLWTPFTVAVVHFLLSMSNEAFLYVHHLSGADNLLMRVLAGICFTEPSCTKSRAIWRFSLATLGLFFARDSPCFGIVVCNRSMFLFFHHDFHFRVTV